MVHIDTPTRSDISAPDEQQEISTGQQAAVAVRRRIWPFWQHFLEMFAAMWLGMAAGRPVLLAILGLSSTGQAYRLYPAIAVAAMAIAMTVPMVAWMLLRGHGRRNSAEMSAAMLVPAIPFIILCSVDILAGGVAACVYMMFSVVAMLGLMFYRRDVYSMPMRGLWHRRSGR